MVNFNVLIHTALAKDCMRDCPAGWVSSAKPRNKVIQMAWAGYEAGHTANEIRLKIHTENK